MPVYKHEYRAYEGRTTPLWSRVSVLVRYGLAEAWSSRITVGLVTLGLLPVIVDLVLIYLANNPLARALVTRGSAIPFAIGSTFFVRVLAVQCWLALVLNAWVAPRLISFDLSDNALPILLSHPISRFGYVFGKFVALFSMLSLLTWIPCLLLFGYQAYTSATPWFGPNLQVGAGLFFGSVIWVGFISVLGLAVSSLVRWRMVATGAIFAAVFVPAGIGGVISGILRTRWGLLINLPVVMTQLWERLLGAPEVMHADLVLPTSAMVTVLLISMLVFGIFLNARIRAREVVRG